MRFLAAAVLACVAGVLYSQEVPCSDDFSDMCPPIENGTVIYFPVEEDCTQYCQCSDGTAWLFTCPGDTVWDTDNHICNWYWDVDCDGRPIP
ncbi:hypothetical protein Pcinc_024205 [Petrolisthes cinctipes]|uniref:Chitin-binding type-2 domain-containing protein n=1 Tax=Petrolisthes cinctipes TaxID=88211 RepID=A0AAE1KFN2_PETCI|nr:hypothetical protein Pcinc_024205 [Petrolisthes cinctipes]